MNRLRNLFKKRSPNESSADESQTVVTDATLSEYRKKIFARGKKFVYPVHVAQHKIVFISVAFFISLTFGSVFGFGLSIYRYGHEGDLIYRVSKIVPYPAIKVDGDYGSYREYLVILRSAKAFLRQRETSSPDSNSIGEEDVQRLRTESIYELSRRVLLKRLADENGFSVDRGEVDEQLSFLQAVSGSSSRFDEIIGEYYDLSAAELREQIEVQLMKQKAAQFLDEEAIERADTALLVLQEGSSFADVIGEYGDKEQDPLLADENGMVVIVTDDRDRYPLPVVDTLQSLGEGDLSGKIFSSQGIHVVKRGKTNDQEVEILHFFVAYNDINQLLDQRLASSDIVNYLD